MKSLFLSIILFSVQLGVFGQMDHEEGQILVQFDTKSVPERVVDRYHSVGDKSLDLRLGKQLSEVMNIYVVEFNMQSVDEKVLLGKLRKDTDVLNAQFNHFVSSRETVPNDPQLESQWHHINNGQNGGTEGADIDTDLAWDITTGGTTALGDTIVVCIIEGGNLGHDDLIDNAWINYGEIPDNGIDDDANTFVDDYLGWNVANDDDSQVYLGGHGTQVMGMIGAKGDNDIGLVGANWDVKMMSVTGENLGNELSVISAYNYALVNRKLYDETDGARGAFVVATNASWGIDNGDPNEVPLWSAFYDTLGVYGILNCGATANNNVNIDIVGDIPTAAPSDYMISVTATNSNDVRTFSGFGQETIDLGAPGSSVFTTAGSNGYTSTSGTSFASPLTAGVIALMYSSPCEEFAQLVKDDPQFGADYVRYQLFQGTDPIENLEFETVTGGRLNAFNSIQAIMDNCAFDQCLPVLGLSAALSADTVYTISYSLLQETLVNIRFRPVGTEDWTVVENVEGTEFVVDTLQYCTEYEFQAATVCEGIDPEEISYSESTTVLTKGCCDAVTEDDFLTASVLEETVNLEWSVAFAIDSYDISFRPSGSSTWEFVGSFEDGSAEIEGLEPCNFYDFRINPTCDDSETTTLLDIRTKGCGNCIDLEFCESASNNSSEEFLDEVTIGDYTNSSGNNGGYALFEDTGLELDLGDSYEIELVPGFPGPTFLEFFRVWLDMDQDGVYSDNEILISSEEGSNQPLEGSISIPDETLEGDTRLRIAMKYVGGNVPDNVEACEIYGWGETEDYCVTVVNITSVLNSEQIRNFNIYPNPTQGEFSVELDLASDFGSDNYFFELIDVSGRAVLKTQVFNGVNQLVTNATSGAYLFRVVDAQGVPVKTGKLMLTD